MDDYRAVIGQLDHQLGQSVLMSLATCADNRPTVRTVNGYYRNGAVYLVTHTGTRKMRDMARNSLVGLSRDRLCATGRAYNLGHPRDEDNQSMMGPLRRVFYTWYDRQVHEEDPGICIVKVQLMQAVVYGNGYRYEVDFTSGMVDKTPVVEENYW